VSGREDPAGPPPDGVDPQGTRESVRTGDGAAAALAREVYWASEGTTRFPTDDGSLPERLDAFAHRLRVEQRQLVPVDAMLLGSTSSWKRRVKAFIWRLTRFSTMRYDRLLAEVAEMNGELARRLRETEEEIARLREELDRRGGGSS
jgi:hypothetical protein